MHWEFPYKASFNFGRVTGDVISLQEKETDDYAVTSHENVSQPSGASDTASDSSAFSHKSPDYYTDFYNAALKSRCAPKSQSPPSSVSPKSVPLNLSFTLLRDPPPLIPSSHLKPVATCPTSSNCRLRPQTGAVNGPLRRKLLSDDTEQVKAARLSFKHHRSMSESSGAHDPISPPPYSSAHRGLQQWLPPQTSGGSQVREEKPQNAIKKLAQKDALHDDFGSNMKLLSGKSGIPTKTQLSTKMFSETSKNVALSSNPLIPSSSSQDICVSEKKSGIKASPSFNSGPNIWMNPKQTPSLHFQHNVDPYPGISSEHLEMLHKSYPYLFYPLHKQISPHYQNLIPYQKLLSPTMTSPRQFFPSHLFDKQFLFEKANQFFFPAPSTFSEAPHLHSRSDSFSSLESNMEATSDSGIESHEGEDKLEEVSLKRTIVV